MTSLYNINDGYRGRSLPGTREYFNSEVYKTEKSQKQVEKPVESTLEKKVEKQEIRLPK